MADADYSQIEYRVLTAMAGNKELAVLFENPDSDYHTLMASLMYEEPYESVTAAMRSAAKSFNFGIPYGMGLGSLAILLYGVNNAKTRADAAEKLEMYYKNQPRTKKFFQDVKEMALVNGFTQTLFHRYRYYSFNNEDGTVNEARKAAALRQAGNAVIQGTAADIFKIGVARNFTFIRNNNILGKLLIVNMVHDEQLLEIDAQSLNVQRILTEVGKNMQFKLDGFPPLYIGAGIGKAWGYAKGKMAEIHPNLLKELTEEAENIPIFRDATTPVNTDDVLNYFDSRVLNFRKQKVYNYITNSENWGKDMHPAIGSLINLQFNYGRGEDAKEYKKEDGSSVTDAEFLTMNLTDFIKETGAQVDPNVFSTQEMVREVEKDSEYDDNEDAEDIDDIFEDYEAEDFTEGVIERTDNTIFGSTINDLVAQFKVFVSRRNKICAIDTRDLYYKNKDAILDYLEAHSVKINDGEVIPEDAKILEVAFLSTGNQLNRTGIYVKGVKQGELEKLYKYQYSMA